MPNLASLGSTEALRASGQPFGLLIAWYEVCDARPRGCAVDPIAGSRPKLGRPRIARPQCEEPARFARLGRALRALRLTAWAALRAADGWLLAS